MTSPGWGHNRFIPIPLDTIWIFGCSAIYSKAKLLAILEQVLRRFMRV